MAEKVQEPHFPPGVSICATPLYQCIPLTEASNLNFYFAQLGYWDNVQGPTSIAVWPKVTSDVKTCDIKLTATVCLQGLVTKEQNDQRIESSVIFMKEKGFCIFTASFCTPDKGVSLPHTLSLVFEACERLLCMTRLGLLELWAERAVRRFRVLKIKDELATAITVLTGELTYLCVLWSSLKLAPVPMSIQVRDTLVGEGDAGEEMRRFLVRAVTGHLICGGRSVVIGESCSKINLMIKTLCLLTPEEDRHMCRGVVEGPDKPYCPYLLVQGVLGGGQEESLGVASWRLCQAPGPSCVINIDRREVGHTALLADHVVRLHDVTRHDLECLWHVNSGAVGLMRLDLTPCSEYKSTIVEKMLTQITELLGAGGEVADQYLRIHTAALADQAATLIEYVAHYSAGGKNPQQVKLKLGHLRAELQLKDQADFLIVLAMAERLRAGVTCLLLGNHSLFESLAKANAKG